VRGNLHAAFDVAGAGNVAWSRWCDTRRPTGNTNFDLNRRVSPRPYRHEDGPGSRSRSGSRFLESVCAPAQLSEDFCRIRQRAMRRT
jgi:hypothetical protein